MFVCERERSNATADALDRWTEGRHPPLKHFKTHQVHVSTFTNPQTHFLPAGADWESAAVAVAINALFGVLKHIRTLQTVQTITRAKHQKTN